MGVTMEHAIKSEKIVVERKQFFFDLKENDRGRFLKITEDVNGRRDTIIIPSPGLADFVRILDEMLEYDEENEYPASNYVDGNR
ncbi:MAG: PUR family DNA/RNA-binding protein [Blastochloris sp.]|nr:PUR family DNA/RNA-binding protein [Blastochloris sp.]